MMYDAKIGGCEECGDSGLGGNQQVLTGEDSCDDDVTMMTAGDVQIPVIWAFLNRRRGETVIGGWVWGFGVCVGGSEVYY
jgi:hypothetical protein